MSKVLNLSLPDELIIFVNENCGEGTPYSTPSEFLRSLIREKMEHQDATRLREAVIEGYQDALDELKKREKEGWR